MDGGLSGVGEQHVGAHRPGAGARECLRGPLNEIERGDLSVFDCQMLFDNRHAGAEHEVFAEVVHGARPLCRAARFGCRFADRVEQVLPGRVGVGVGGEEGAHASLERLLAHQIVQLLEHTWRFVINDWAVVRFRLIEIAEFLPERVGAGGLVDAVGCGLVALVEGLPCAGGGIERPLRFGGHVGGEAFFEPEIVEPFHGDQITEPLVRDFVEDRGEASESPCECGAIAEDEGVLVVHHEPWVLHAAEGEGWGEEDVELFERVGAIEVLLHPSDGAVVECEDRVGVGFFEARAAHEDADGATVDR